MRTCTIIKKIMSEIETLTDSFDFLTFIHFATLKAVFVWVAFNVFVVSLVLPVRTSVESLPLWNLETPDTCCCSCRCCVTTRCGAVRGGVNTKVSWEWTSRVMWFQTPMASSVAIALPGSWRFCLCMTPIKIHETTGDVFILQVWQCQGLERKESKQTYP